MRQIGINLVGLGGAGGKVVDQVAGNVQEGPATVAVNTDASELSDSRAAGKLQLGAGRTGGFGTGGDVSLGRLAAEDESEMIRALFNGVKIRRKLQLSPMSTISGQLPTRRPVRTRRR